MAIDKQNQQKIKETATYVEDTLRSVASNIGVALKDAVNAAFDEKDATVLSSVGKDFRRSMMDAARSSEDLVRNSSRLEQGLLSSRDVSKQLQQINDRQLAVARRREYIETLLEDSKNSMNKAERRSLANALKQESQAQIALKTQQNMLEKDLKRTQEIEKTIGLTGKLVGALGKIPGLGQFINAAEIEQEMRKVADTSKSTFASMTVAAKMVGDQLFGGLTDPAFLLGTVLETYLDINKASVELQRYTGQNEVTVGNLNMSYASLKDYLEVSLELTKQFGRTAQNIFSEKVIAGAAEVKLLMGLTVEQAGGLALLSQTNNTSVEKTTDSIVQQVNSYNKINRSAVSHRMILEDVATTSDSIKLSMGNSANSIASAASSARKLGLSLQEVDQIAASLLNFETSIGNELEAELLTGKNLNLERARELALRNDLEGVGKELLSNSADIYEFGRMNRLQQESYASALGLTRDQLAKIAYNRALDLNMSDKQAAAAANVNAEDMKRLTTMENFQKAIEKIAGAFAPILDIVGSLLNLPFAPYIVIGAMIGVKALSLLGFTAESTLRSLLRLKAVEQTAASGAGSRAGGIGGIFKNINATDLLKGAAAMAVASVGIFIFGKAVQELDKVKDWGRVAIGLGLFAGSMVALGYALSLAAPAITIGVGPVLALGAAVLMLGAGVGLAAAGMSMFVNSITGLTLESIAPMLMLGPALYGIAGGLTAVAAAGLLALPAIGGLILLSKAAPGLVTLGIGGEQKSAGAAKKKGEEGSLAAVEAKLDTLINVVKQGTAIYLDGKQISTSVSRNLPAVVVYSK